MSQGSSPKREGLSRISADGEDALATLMALREEHRAGLLSDDDFAALSDAATARAAKALRVLEQEPQPQPDQAGSPAGADPQSSSGGKSRRRRRWVYLGAALACFAVAAGILVGRFAATRLPGQQITGTVQLTQQQQMAQELVQGRTLVSQGKDLAALSVFRSVLATQANQPEALAYVGWLLALSGAAQHSLSAIEQGRSYISEAVSADPGYPDAHLFLGMLLYRYEKDTRDALIQFRLFLLDDPSSALANKSWGTIVAAFHAAGLQAPKKP